MNSRSNSLFFSVVTAATFALTSLSGCSWFSSGSGDEDQSGQDVSETELETTRENRFGKGSIPTAEGEGLFRDIHFGYDSYSIDEEARNDLEANAQVLRDNPSVHVTLEGHTDERGTAEYNMALGAERARAVKGALVALGISGSRFDTISYGEEIPLDPSHSEGAWAKNRRAHFSGGTGAPPKATTKKANKSLEY